jgi:hypothetical protein
MEMATGFSNLTSVISLVEQLNENLYLGLQDPSCLFISAKRLYYSRRFDDSLELALIQWSSFVVSSWSYSLFKGTKSALRFETVQAYIKAAGDSSRTNPQHFKGLKCMRTDSGHLGMERLGTSDSV